MIGATTAGVQIWVATALVDMRKGFARLAELVRSFWGQNPLSGHLFVFRNRSSQRLTILWWDGTAWFYITSELSRPVSLSCGKRRVVDH